MQKVAVITGGGRGIGAATAKLAAQRGFAVAVNYRERAQDAEKVAAAIRQGGGKAIAVQADTAVEADIVRLFKTVDRELGAVTALVNNAGTTGGVRLVQDADAKHLEELFRINVIGCFLCAREAIRRMSTQLGGKGGAIVNVSSKAATLGGGGEWIHYAASKGALDSFTIGLTREVGAQGIRVNSVRPGMIDTELQGHPAAQVPELVAGNNAFALDLYADLLKSRAKDNLVLSPYSVSLALAMTYGGASGDTAKEMEHVLHFAMPADEIHRAFAAQQARQKAVFAPKGYELNVANSLWGQKGFAFHESYFNLTREKYGAALEEIDFRASPEIARQRINAWVEQRTKNKIANLVQKGAIDEDTRLVLANAVYLKGAWAKQFSLGLTRKDFFQVDADTKTPILMMSQRGRFRYFEDTDLQAIDLPIGTGGVSMWILLPRQVDGLAKLEKSLTNQRLQKLRMQMNDEAVTVELPKFKIESELNLTKSLNALGMASAFSMDKADFSKMAARPGIVLKAVAHKAYLNVDETGLEAAAATAVVGKEGAPPPPKLVFRADHPFFYVIRESSTGSILFMGRVTNPGGKDKVAVKPAPTAVDLAVAAHGGKERLAKLRAAELTFHIKGSDFPLVAGKKLEALEVKVSEIYNLPNQIKKSIEGKVREAGMLKDEEIKLSWAIDGERVWLQEGKGKIEFMMGSPSAAEGVYRPLQIFEMLARHDAFKWTQPGDIPVDPEEKLIAMSATDPKQPGAETTFLFSKATGLLERTRVVRNLPGSPHPVVGEVVYADYQDVGGAKLPMRKTIRMDGKNLAEIRITQVRFLEKVDPNLFAPPAAPTANNQESLKAYLTPNGQLKEPIVLRDAGGFVGRGTGARWEIETDGAWKRIAREGNSFTTTEGRLDAKQLTTLAKELARFDLLSLPKEMRHDPKMVVADGFNVLVEFGKQRWTFLAVRGLPDLPTPGLETPQGRFAGIARAIQISVIDRPAEKNK